MKTWFVNAGVLNGTWLHFFLLYLRKLWGMIQWISWKDSCFLLIICIFFLKSGRSLSKKLVRKFSVYSVWKLPFFDVLGYICLSSVSRGLKDPSIPQVCLLPFFDTICIFKSPSFTLHFFCVSALLFFVCVQLAWDLKHCRGWKRNYWGCLAFNFMENGGSANWVRQICNIQIRLFNIRVVNQGNFIVWNCLVIIIEKTDFVHLLQRADCPEICKVLYLPSSSFYLF